MQKPLSEALLDRQLLKLNDYGKEWRHKTLHLAFQALHGFVKKEQRLPDPWSQVCKGYKPAHLFAETSLIGYSVLS